MDIYKRMKTTELIKLRKRLKYPLKKVAEVMPKDFTDEEFVNSFKGIYPSLWAELENRRQSNLREYKNRRRKGLKAMLFLSSKDLILDVAKISLQKSRNGHSTDEYELEKLKK